jgi:hypothetical protein
MISRISLSHETAVKIKVTFSVLLVAHWFACVFALSATLHRHPRDTWWGQRWGFCATLTNTDPDAGFMEACGLTASRFYVASFTWAMLIVTGTGGTDSFPNPNSDAENLVVTAVNMAASLFWVTVRALASTRLQSPMRAAWPLSRPPAPTLLGGLQVLALFCDMTTNSNPELTEFQQTVDELETFMRNHDLPDIMRRKLREYFHQRKHVRISERAFSVTQQMSTKLQAEVIGLIYGSWLSNIPFLRGCEKACVPPAHDTPALAARE